LSAVFRDYDQAALDAQYDQRAWAPNAEEVIARYASDSEAARKRLGEPGTHAYGASDAEKLDLYRAHGARSTLVFVHGGAWRRQMRRESAFAAAPIVAAGHNYVALGFAALPAVTLEVMADQVCRALEWLRRHVSGELALCAHSSGAHLAACALTRLGFFSRALLVSGLYDLEPVRLSSRNSYVRLDARLEADYSPMRHAARIRCPVTVALGEKESPEFTRQSLEFAAALGAPAVVCRGKNHFEVIELLADQDSPLARATWSMAAQTRAGE
jgi:arylformamidase